MKYLIICREYPPAPSGGIGTYVLHISRLLAEKGETVHVIGQLWEGAEKEVEEKCNGRLIIHRVPLDDWTSWRGHKPSPELKSREARTLFTSDFYPESFSWQASLLAERLVEQEGIDVIEAQEFEAPLYYFQLRRALGLGPKRLPPCIVHLHSPTELIVRYNDWDIGKPYFLRSKRLEDYSIAAADALLCPSRYLAHQAEAHYGLAKNSIRVIPLPIGDSPLLKRSKETWERGTICYVGRLERRKGVLEWLEAAVAVGREYPAARFEFIGANILGPNGVNDETLIERRIPKNMRKRFLFRGPQKRTLLPRFLAKARIAVVPSRWENFPNTCLEAMCSGLPVIASPEGGMAEMIEDGQTGWLAEEARSDSLAVALRHALETPPMKLAEMGRQASSAIRQMCDNQKIVEDHLNLHNQLVCQGSKRSLYMPVNLPWAKGSLSDESARRSSPTDSYKGLAIVVTCFNAGQVFHECLRSIEQQTQKPAAVVIIDEGSTETQTLIALSRARRAGWQIIRKEHGGPIATKNIGIEAVLGSGLNPLGFAFLTAENRLLPGFVGTCESVLQRCPEVGLVSCWNDHSEDSDSTWIRPCPSFPYQWVANEAAPFSVVRTEALREAGNFRLGMSEGYENWDLFNAVMVAGWVAVTIPEILGSQRTGNHSMLPITDPHTHMRMRQELLERFSEQIALDVQDIVLLIESKSVHSLSQDFLVQQEQLALMRTLLRHPQETTLRVLGKVKQKILRRTRVWIPNFISRMMSYKGLQP